MRATTLLLFILLLAACTAERIQESAVLAVGHGGAGFPTYRNNVPPNTLAAMLRGFHTEGADGVEMDLQLTSDSVVILFHDRLLDEASECVGCVSQWRWEEISSCRLSTKNGPADGHYTIPALTQVLDSLVGTDCVFFLNVKSHDPCVQGHLSDYRSRFARQLSHIIGSRNLYERVWVETYDQDFLLACRAVDSSLHFIFDDDRFEFGLQTAINQHYDGFAIPNENANAEQVSAAQDSGKMVILWGVKLLGATKDAVAKNPDVIMTDDVRMLRHVTGE